MTEAITEFRDALAAHGQGHLLRFAEDLSPAELNALHVQIEQLDLVALDELIETYVRNTPEMALPADLAPAPYYANDPATPGREYDAAEYRAAGQNLIRAGRVAAFTVAGGQGTRLGWNGPKGTFPATAVTGKPLFRCFAEQIRANQERYGVTIPWYIMTSPINDAATRAFMTDNNCFGLNRHDIFMFPQGVMPAFNRETGGILLAGKGELAVSPDGHGGSIKALRESGAIQDMAARGIEHISYFQVDNPLVKVIDPLFLGLHATAPDSSGEMSSKMVPKTGPKEKVGVFCTSGGKTMVIEYSDLPDDLAEQLDDDGNLRFVAGSIAIHILSVALVDRLTAEGRFELPWHRAEKKSPCVDLDTGEDVSPEEPNAIKLEAFVFDAIPLAESSIVYETSRAEEFAPIKNATGVDSAHSSERMQSERSARWLEANGVKVARTESGEVNARIEISALTALEPDDLAEQDLPQRVSPGEEVVL